ncbi:uncharacterized protein LOC144119567 [Amblyomma americanum]
MLSYLAAIGCLVLAVPPVVIGAIAKTTNFTAAGYPGPYNLHREHRKDVLATAIQYMTPPSVSTLGLTAIIAAVMSSVDSSMLSASSLITRNIYHFIFRPTLENLPEEVENLVPEELHSLEYLSGYIARNITKKHKLCEDCRVALASDGEVAAVLRFTLCLVGAVSTFAALRVNSVFTLWTLSSDLVYVLLFPQFVSLFFLRNESNAYGAFVGFVAGIVLRALCGEPNVNVPVTIRLPLYDSQRGQQFPFRTLCMLFSLFTALVTSALAAAAFRRKLIPERLDVWSCFVTPCDQRSTVGDAQRTVGLGPNGHDDGHTAGTVDSKGAARTIVKGGNLVTIFPSSSSLTNPTTHSDVSSVRKELAPLEDETVGALPGQEYAEIESNTDSSSSRAPEDQNAAVGSQTPSSPSSKDDAPGVPGVKPQRRRQKRAKPKRSKVASRDSGGGGIASVDRNIETKRKLGRAKADKDGSRGHSNKRSKVTRSMSPDAAVSSTEQANKTPNIETPREETTTALQETPLIIPGKPKVEARSTDARVRREGVAGSREGAEDSAIVSKDTSARRRKKKRLQA